MPNLQDKAAGPHSSFTYQLRRVGGEADVAVLQADSEFAGRRPMTGRLTQLQPLLRLSLRHDRLLIWSIRRQGIFIKDSKSYMAQKHHIIRIVPQMHVATYYL